MKPDSRKPKTRSGKIGICNLCGVTGNLTDDHVPPKGLLRPTQVEIMEIAQFLQVTREKKDKRISQNGLKYKTICNTCNNDRLGQRCDPALISFGNKVKDLLQTRLALPQIVFLECEINKVLRSLVGHLLASRIDGYDQGTARQQLQDYFRDESRVLPENINAYLWIYPFNDQVVLNGTGVIQNLGSAFATIFLLKFFPLAIMFVVDEPPTWVSKGLKLNLYLSSQIDALQEIPVEVHNIPPHRWPENPGKNDLVMFTDDAIGTRIHSPHNILVM